MNQADTVDAALGARLREIRLNAGISQAELAEALSFDPVEVEACERGSHRFTATTLCLAARALGQPVAAFFESGQ